MSDELTSEDGAKAKGRRIGKFKSILKRRGKPFPVLLAMIVVLAVAMVYSLVTGAM